MIKGKLSRKGKGTIKRFLIIFSYNYNAFKGGLPFFILFHLVTPVIKDKTNDALKEVPKANPKPFR